MDSIRLRVALLAIFASVSVGCDRGQPAELAGQQIPNEVSGTTAQCRYFYVDIFDSLFPLPSNMVAQNWMPDGGDSILLFVSRNRAGQVSDPFELVRMKFTQFAAEREIEVAYPSDLFEMLDSRKDGDIHSWTYRIKGHTLPTEVAPARNTYSFVASSRQYRVDILSSNAKLGRRLFDKFLSLRVAKADDLPADSECIAQ